MFRLSRDRHLKDVPILGKLIGKLWEDYVERRTRLRIERIQRKKAKQERRRREIEKHKMRALEKERVTRYTVAMSSLNPFRMLSLM